MSFYFSFGCHSTQKKYGLHTTLGLTQFALECLNVLNPVQVNAVKLVGRFKINCTTEHTHTIGIWCMVGSLAKWWMKLRTEYPRTTPNCLGLLFPQIECTMYEAHVYYPADDGFKAMHSIWHHIITGVSPSSSSFHAVFLLCVSN